MNKTIIKFITVALLCITTLFSCKKEPVGGVILDNTLTLLVGESATLTVTFVPANAHNKKVSWASSDPNIATVENGKVTGIAIGEAKITVTSQDNGRIAQCIVYVIQPIEPEKMIWVEGGTFMMGPNDGEPFYVDEIPRHEVTISGFYISKYMVTQKEWKAAMGSGSSPDYTIGDDKPAWTMSWNNIQEYITRLNAHTGKNYRLPTEAEWEYAARGGNKSQGYKYSGSDNINEVAWYDGNYNASITLHPVGQKKPNELGIYDMSGNMWEWCSDYWGKYKGEPQINPTGPNTGVYRVRRGGGFAAGSFHCRNAYRYRMDTENSGFRLVLPAE